jgi:predicted dehydrogenase
MKQDDSKSLKGGASRREFLKKTTLATAAVAAGSKILKTPVYGQTQAPAPPSAVGANNRLVVAYIGLGGQGMTHVRTQQTGAAANNIVQAAGCDLSAHRQAEAKAQVGGNFKTFKDYEELLAQKDIDAVTIATVDHWHCKTAIDALEAGKHVYVEKPMTRYLNEAFDLHDTVKKTKKTLQVGSQGCSDGKWAFAASLIKDGKIGNLVLGQDSYMRNNKEGEWNYDLHGDWCNPGDLDWDKWQKPVKNKKAFDIDAFFRWRKYYPYCAGPLGDLFPHRLHPLMLATGNPEFPKRVVCLGQQPVHSDKDHVPPAPLRDCPEDVQMIAEFPSGLALIVTAGTINEQGLNTVIRGNKATLYLSGNRVDLKPEKPYADDMDPVTKEGITPTEDIGVHETNWFECIRSDGKQQPNANIDLAIRVQTVISLAEMSNRLNTMCLFDEKTRKVTTGDGKDVKEILPITYGTLDLS